jgi:ribonuclease-3
LPELDIILENHLEKDSKSELQEIVQARGLPAPIYKVEKEEGPDHDKIFTLWVFINGKRIASGVGKSKQQAQQQAATAALEKYQRK